MRIVVVIESLKRYILLYILYAKIFATLYILYTKFLLCFTELVGSVRGRD